MKLRCIKNQKSGFFGFDYSKHFSVGCNYVLMTPHANNLVYSYLTKQWVRIYTTELTEMFVPVPHE